MSKVILTAVMIFLCGCSSVPLSTMVKFGLMGIDDLADIKPEEIRAKVHIDNPIKIVPDKTKITLELDTDQEIFLYKFDLKLLHTNIIEPQIGWFSESLGKTEYIYSLNDTAIENFRATQSAAATKSLNGFSLSVKWRLDNYNDESDMTVSVYLKLAENQDYFVMFDRLALEFTNED